MSIAARAFGVCSAALGLLLDPDAGEVAIALAGAVVTEVDAGCEADAPLDFFGLLVLVGLLVPLEPVSPASGSTY